MNSTEAYRGSLKGKRKMRGRTKIAVGAIGVGCYEMSEIILPCIPVGHSTAGVLPHSPAG